MIISECLRILSTAHLLGKRSKKLAKLNQQLIILISKGYCANDDFHAIINKYGSAENAPVKGES